MAGANISGNLKNPQVAIPRGTLSAILVSTIVYISVLLIAGTTYERDADGIVTPDPFNQPDCYYNYTCPFGLLNYYQIVMVTSVWPPIISIGIIAATLCSALASLVSAPKIFQAICEDNVIPAIRMFAKGYGPGNDPRRAYALAFFVTTAVLMIDVNWGTSTTATTYMHTLSGVMKLAKDEFHVKNYRPQDTTQMNQQLAAARRTEDMSQKNLRKQGIKGVCKAVVARTLEEGCDMLYQASGLGRLTPNIVLLGFIENDAVDRSRIKLSQAFYNDMGVGVFRSKSSKAFRAHPDKKIRVGNSAVSDSSVTTHSILTKTTSKGSTIDVWWLSDDGGLTLLVPYLLTQSKSYLEVRLKIIVYVLKLVPRI
ncbi:hypothetical protein ANCDUO_10692 [Ancylostoma duodenale]|uniref:Amino acid permease/ SLC12A domain-containing protein n=1 Tax=Ancylostoma duodenale TaxID=51022 RepID=A0A0C2GD86_9BILA|nr:hypothetical protein ANCDUO_10692 [Ancylostoma duodenale]